VIQEQTAGPVQQPGDDRVHWGFAVWWQTMTLCGQRITWPDQRTGPVWLDVSADCAACLNNLPVDQKEEEPCHGGKSHL
jgi:hypothetical protein